MDFLFTLPAGSTQGSEGACGADRDAGPEDTAPWHSQLVLPQQTARAATAAFSEFRSDWEESLQDVYRFVVSMTSQEERTTNVGSARPTWPSELLPPRRTVLAAAEALSEMRTDWEEVFQESKDNVNHYVTGMKRWVVPSSASDPSSSLAAARGWLLRLRGSRWDSSSLFAASVTAPPLIMTPHCTGAAPMVLPKVVLASVAPAPSTVLLLAGASCVAVYWYYNPDQCPLDFAADGGFPIRLKRSAVAADRSGWIGAAPSFGDEQQISMLVAEQHRQVILDHLQTYLNQQGAAATFEEWIADLHPDNIIRGEVDPRLYLPGSEHLRIWNSNVDEEHQVAPRCT